MTMTRITLEVMIKNSLTAKGMPEDQAKKIIALAKENSRFKPIEEIWAAELSSVIQPMQDLVLANILYFAKEWVETNASTAPYRFNFL